MNMHRWLACVLTLALPGLALGQDPAVQEYLPLFSPEMIEQASPEQAARMRTTEERNRQVWDERQAAARQHEQTEAQQAREASQSASEQPPRAKNRIFKWVDKDGRVHFGDAPQGQGAQEVEVRGITRVPANQPPVSGNRGGERE